MEAAATLNEDINDSASNADNQPAAKKLVDGITFRKLKPEVKSTLEKVVY